MIQAEADLETAILQQGVEHVIKESRYELTCDHLYRRGSHVLQEQGRQDDGKRRAVSLVEVFGCCIWQRVLLIQKIVRSDGNALA